MIEISDNCYRDLIRFLESREDEIAMNCDGFGKLRDIFTEIIEREPYEY